MTDSKLAAQLYTVRDFAKTPKDIRETLEKVKKIGYDAVQVSGIGRIDPRELKNIVDGLGLTICCSHTGFDRLQNDLDAVIEEHRLWNCGGIGLGAMPGAYRKSLESVRDFVRDIGPIAKKIRGSGLTFLYHNHKFEFERFGAKTVMEILAESFSPEELEFLPDSYWIQAGGADPAEFVKTFAGRISIVHLKDMKIVSDEQKMCEVGEGNLNFKRFIAECEKAGVRWYAVEQDVCDGDPFDSLALSFKNCGRLGLI